ncbi:MAG: hypothetical protein LDL44_03655 [Caenispirillum sp.]|nr:hypothetical protein [Caenispirillum sp.]
MNWDAAWAVVQWLALPAVGGLLGLIWRLDAAQAARLADAEDRRRSEAERLWAEVTALRQQLHAWQLESEARYVRYAAMAELRDFIDRRVSRLEDRLAAGHTGQPGHD